MIYISYTNGLLYLTGAPAYLGEMSPPSIRGLLVSLKEASIVIGGWVYTLLYIYIFTYNIITECIYLYLCTHTGILLGFLIGYLFSSINGGWVYTYGIIMIPAAIMLVGSQLLLKESTRFLYLKGRNDEAKVLLIWYDMIADGVVVGIGW